MWTDEESSDEEGEGRPRRAVETGSKALVEQNEEIEEWMGRRITFYGSEDLSSGHGFGTKKILLPGVEGVGELTTPEGEGTKSPNSSPPKPPLTPNSDRGVSFEAADPSGDGGEGVGDEEGKGANGSGFDAKQKWLDATSPIMKRIRSEKDMAKLMKSPSLKNLRLQGI